MSGTAFYPQPGRRRKSGCRSSIQDLRILCRHHIAMNCLQPQFLCSFGISLKRSQSREWSWPCNGGSPTGACRYNPKKIWELEKITRKEKESRSWQWVTLTVARRPDCPPTSKAPEGTTQNNPSLGLKGENYRIEKLHLHAPVSISQSNPWDVCREEKYIVLSVMLVLVLVLSGCVLEENFLGTDSVSSFCTEEAAVWKSLNN